MRPEHEDEIGDSRQLAKKVFENIKLSIFQNSYIQMNRPKDQ